MTPLNKFEVKASAFSVGMGLILMALGILTGPEESLFLLAITAAGLGDWWAGVMMPVGIALMYSSVLPRRAVRHQFLCAAMVICFVTFGAFAWWGRITFPAMMILWMGFMALTSFLVDVCGHARVRLEQRNANVSGELAR